MSKRALALLVTFTLIFGLIGNVPLAQASASSLREGSDTAALLFDPLKPISISLLREIGGPALTRSYLDSPTYRRASIKISLSGTKKYVVIHNVGIRMKGSASRRYQKFSIKVKFDAFVKSQDFRGLKRLTLNAMMQDPSQVHEVTAYRLFRAAGIPAPRAGYAKVKIDGHYIGLYLNLESIDSKMLKRWFPDTEHVYSGARPCDLTPNNSCYITNTGTTDRTDVLEVGKLHFLEGKAWWKALSKKTDTNQLLDFMATEIFLSHWDGFGDYMRNNHYIHFDSKGRFTLIPWGTDQTFPFEKKHQLTWDASKPVYLSTETERSSILVHCMAYLPCHDKLLRSGLKISKLASRIDLVGYADRVIGKINQKRLIRNDLKRINPETREMEQNWISSYVPLSQKSLKVYLSLHSPIKLSVKVPKEFRIKQLITAEIERNWEPGVKIRFQWFQSGKPIANATKSTIRITTKMLAKKIKLRITLKKDSVSDTVYFSRELKVKPEK